MKKNSHWTRRKVLSCNHVHHDEIRKIFNGSCSHTDGKYNTMFFKVTCRVLYTITRKHMYQITLHTDVFLWRIIFPFPCVPVHNNKSCKQGRDVSHSKSSLTKRQGIRSSALHEIGYFTVVFPALGDTFPWNPWSYKKWKRVLCFTRDISDEVVNVWLGDIYTLHHSVFLSGNTNNFWRKTPKDLYSRIESDWTDYIIYIKFTRINDVLTEDFSICTGGCHTLTEKRCDNGFDVSLVKKRTCPLLP